jgi:hypothetical protein
MSGLLIVGIAKGDPSLLGEGEVSLLEIAVLKGCIS